MLNVASLTLHCSFSQDGDKLSHGKALGTGNRATIFVKARIVNKVLLSALPASYKMETVSTFTILQLQSHQKS